MPVRSRLRVRYARELAQFEIQDSGIGIPAQDIERIFLPFERSGTASQRDDIGTGLGLAISSMLSHIMGGQLTVDSVVGEGSKFTLKIYLSEVRSPRARIKLNDQMSGYLGERKTILVVDDQASQRTLLAEMLIPIGFDVVQVESGAACLIEIERQMPDLVLLDIAMPAMDGWATCSAIRDRGHAQLPIIIVSANAFDSSMRRAEKLQNDDFVVKPVSLNELLSKIKLHLGIDWIPRPQPPPQTVSVTKVVQMIPNADVLRKLLDLGSIGYVKGILKQLDEIEQQDRAYAPFAIELRKMVKQFRLNEYTNRIKEVMRHDVDNIG